MDFQCYTLVKYLAIAAIAMGLACCMIPKSDSSPNKQEFTVSNAPTAKFIADTSRLWLEAGNSQTYKSLLKEMEWRIRGQVLHFGSSPIEIPVNPDGTDTLFYKQSNNSNWDTIRVAQT